MANARAGGSLEGLEIAPQDLRIPQHILEQQHPSETVVQQEGVVGPVDHDHLAHQRAAIERGKE